MVTISVIIVITLLGIERKLGKILELLSKEGEDEE